MNDKPNHYDGSMHQDAVTTSDSTYNESFTLTDEMRKNISGNPYLIENSE